MFSNLNPQTLIIQIPVILFALTIHEFSHGYVAYLCGDHTAKSRGRLTMNPLKHLDPMGTIAIILIHFGWAKPVPVDPRNFRNPNRDMILVALAGPAANIAAMIASIFALIFLANSEAVIPHFVFQPLSLMFTFSVLINSILAVFNMIPIPPLDGSKVLMGFLPAKQARAYAQLEKYGFFIILILAFTGVLGKFLSFTQNILISILMGW